MNKENKIMTTIFFVRHAEPDLSIHDDYSRPLTPKGASDCSLVIDLLHDKKIDVVLSSPFKRAVDTVLPFANSANLQVETIEDFRERKVDSGWIDDFNAFTKKQWEDFTYKLTDGECLLEVQERNIKALKQILDQHSGRNIVVGTHGTALSTIINYYNNAYGYEDFKAIAGIFPWVVKMEFDGKTCLEIEQMDLMVKHNME